MDYSWRPRPPLPPPTTIPGNVCPTCSVPHLPFCPPLSSFHHNPRFQSPNAHAQFYQRPHLDDHCGPGASPHPSFVDGFGYQPRPWIRNPGLDGDSCGKFHGNSEFGDADLVDGVHSYSRSGVKRMRVYEPGSALSSSKVPSEDERRLKLIRDHGGRANGLLQGGMNSAPGFNHESRGHFQGEYGFDRGFDDDGANDAVSSKSSTFGLSDFRAQGFDNIDRKSQDSRFNAHNHGEEHGLAFGNQYTQIRGNIGSGQSQYGLMQNPLYKSLENSSYNLKSQDSDVSVSQKADRDHASHVFHGSNYPNTEAHHGQNDSHSFQQLHHSGSMLAREPPYSYPINWQRLSGSNAPYHEKNSLPIENPELSNLPQSYTMQHHMDPQRDSHLSVRWTDMRQPFRDNLLPHDSIQGPVIHQNFASNSQYGLPNKQGGYLPFSNGISLGPTKASGVLDVQPPLPASPPPPLPGDSPRYPLSKAIASSSPPKSSSSLFPIHVGASENAISAYPLAPEAHPSVNYFSCTLHPNASSGFVMEEFQAIHKASSNSYLGENQSFPPRQPSPEKSKIVDALQIFKHPHRATRPDHIVIILRGLPGSGKSYLAKMLRDLEVENGGDVPRIHSMDDYFMTEVEKVEETEGSRSGSVRGKKTVPKRVMEYCYEPEMEEAYRSSMLKAFKKTLDEGVFSFIIVDDRNLRVADFAQFWATAKRSGYEVYLLEAAYKDPVGCAARNVHGFTLDDIQKMAGKWEETPSLYLKLDIKSLLHGGALEESGIQEVDMDTEDGDPLTCQSGLEEINPENASTHIRETASDGPSEDDRRHDAEGDHPALVKELGKSKWSDDLDEIDAQRTEVANLSSLSGFIQAYCKGGKYVYWGDQVGSSGFSIGVTKNTHMVSLEIGPGAGYNLKSNPLLEGEKTSARSRGESKKQSVFQEQLRAERESFRAVFDKRRQRIGGFDMEEE